MSDGRCVRTGADVFNGPHGAMLHGDLYECGDVWIFRHTGQWRYVDGPDVPYSLRISRTADYLQLDSKTIIVKKVNCGPFRYDGWPVGDADET